MPIRRTAILAATVVAALALVALRGWLAGGPRAPPVAAAPAPAPAPSGAVIVAVSPRVERTAAGGAWIPARAGDPLGRADAIRTGHGGSAEVSLGHGTSLVVDERSEISVTDLDAAAQRIQLVRGRVGVAHRRDGARLVRVQDGSGTILASSAGGRWSAVASHDVLAVAAEEGAVRLESAGAAVDVPAGSESAAWRGAAPLPARPVSAAVLLRVAHAIAERRRSACAALQVDVASEVWVNGEPAPVAPDGRVVVRVPEERQRLPVDVVVRHVTGATRRERVRCVEDDGDVKAWEVRWDAR
jgi:hypothetical protein